jgi:hypothetical protein
MRRSLHPQTFTLTTAAVACILVTLGALAAVAQPAPCKGTKRLQLRWSSTTGTALLSLSATQCDRPPKCRDNAGPRAAGTMFTKSPISIAIKDASGRTLSGVVDAGAATCSGRCERVNRGGCLGGADTHRLAGGFVRYAVNTQGQTTVVANKLKLPVADQPKLVTPISVSVTDGDGYAITAELRNCRVRESGGGMAVTCS